MSAEASRHQLLYHSVPYSLSQGLSLSLELILGRGMVASSPSKFHTSTPYATRLQVHAVMPTSATMLQVHRSHTHLCYQVTGAYNHTHLCRRVTGVCSHTNLFAWLLRNWTRAFMLASRPSPPLSHLARPSLFFGSVIYVVLGTTHVLGQHAHPGLHLQPCNLSFFLLLRQSQVNLKLLILMAQPP